MKKDAEELGTELLGVRGLLVMMDLALQAANDPRRTGSKPSARTLEEAFYSLEELIERIAEDLTELAGEALKARKEAVCRTN